MFYFGPYIRFLPFTALDLPLRAWGGILTLGRAAIHLVANPLFLMVTNYGILPFLSTQISAVSVYDLFFAAQEFRHHGHIVYIGTGAL